MLKGDLKNEVGKFQKILTDCLAELEVTLDYPEHDDEEITLNSAKKILSSLYQQITNLLQTSNTGKIIKNGLNIAIIGKPNVGKSSLLNALIGENRAIVTNIAGTTRDTITETISFNGMKFNFIDTAGIRESEDIVEKIGIERSKQSINESDIVLVVLDSLTGLQEEDKILLDLTKNEKRIILINKTDLNQKENYNYINNLQNNKYLKTNENILEISALKKQNIEKIKEVIFNKIIDNKMDASALILTNIRQTNNLKIAQQTLNEAIEATDNKTVDIVAFLIRRVWEELGKITGETEIESVIDEIFSKFCLGK